MTFVHLADFNITCTLPYMHSNDNIRILKHLTVLIIITAFSLANTLSKYTFYYMSENI